MGLFKSLFKEIICADRKATFTPDFSKSEYDNWLEYLSQGGTTESWNRARKQNNWVFKKSSTEIYMQYQKEVKPISDIYFALMQKIQSEWSILYNLKQYSGTRADALERMCLQDIHYYKCMRDIDLKYGQPALFNVPAFTRLAMLYEKQGKFEDAVSICKEAVMLGIDEKSRFTRMIKKAGRTPTPEEFSLLNN